MYSGRHTRLQGDWSSDVCSSDLRRIAFGQLGAERVVVRLSAVIDKLNDAEVGERRALRQRQPGSSWRRKRFVCGAQSFQSAAYAAQIRSEERRVGQGSNV